MSYFRRARKHNKPSVTLDEKIAKAYKEFEKTGVSAVLLEGPANRTSGVYYAGKEIPEVPAVFTDVPDPNGVRASGWTQPSNGFDSSDPSTWENAFNDTSWLYNSNTVFGEAGRPVTPSPINYNFDLENLPRGAGLVTASVAHGHSLGYIGPGCTYQGILSASYWGGMVPPHDSQFGSAMSGAHYYGISGAKQAMMKDAYAKYQAMQTSETASGVPIKLWYPWSYFWYGLWDNVLGVKKDTSEGKFVLINATLLVDANKYESEPVIPAYTQVIFKDELGRAQNLNMSGFQKLLSKLFEIGTSAVSALYDKPYQFGELVGRNLGDLAGQIGWAAGISDSIDSNKPHIAPEPSDKQKQDYFNRFFDNIANGNPVIGATSVPINDQKQNFADKNIYVDDSGTTKSNIGPNGEQGYYSKPNANTTKNSDSIGSRGEHQTQMYQNKNGDWIFAYDDHAYHNLNSTDAGEVQGPADMISNFIHNSADAKHGRTGGTTGSGSGELGTPTTSPDNTSPNTGGMSNYPCNGTACIRGDNTLSWEINVNDIQNDDVRNALLDQISNKKKQINQDYEPRGQVLSEGYLQDRIDKRNKKRLVEKNVGGKISRINIPGPKDHLTVKAIDMLRQYKVSEKEKQEYATIIGEINQWIRDNPKEYEIWKVRYPANDPRVAELNWKLDQQLKASEEYVETRFPENQKLYRKLKKKIKSNIDATNPKRFEKEKSEVVYTKLLKVSKAIQLDNIAPL